MATPPPDRARAVIVGGGIVGCSVAYHLAEAWSDVVLLERDRIGCGTTWHAAGLVASLRASQALTDLARYSNELYAALERETGQATGYRRNGGLVVARTGERFEEIRRLAATARSFGVDAEIVAPGEAGQLWPAMRTDDLAGALWLPSNAQTNPTDTTQALAKGARRRGARVFEATPVVRILTEDGRASGVRTAAGDIACEVVVLCAGMWSHGLASACGVGVPLHAAEHMYVVTEEIAAVGPGLPTMADPDGYAYYKEEVGGLVVGGFEPEAKPWGMDGIPDGFSFSLLDEDWEHFRPIMEGALARVPALERTGIKSFINGPESFTPDNQYILGEAPELAGLFVAAGFNSVGITSAGGAGRALAEWIVAGEPTMDLGEVDIRRFGRFHRNRAYLRERTVESLGLLYAMHWPFRQLETARPLRRTPLHDRLAGRGACFGELHGWERPNWFAPPGVEPRYAYSYGRQNWFPHAAAEHAAVRGAVAVFDQSAFAKFLLQGRDAEAVLQRLCANDVAVTAGKVVYTAMLNRRGGFEGDLTVTRLAEDSFLIVTGVQLATRDFDWIRRHILDHAHAVLTDVTSAYAVIGVMGPGSRRLLAGTTDADLSNAAFPFATSREIELGYALVRATRITYVGELGWELYVPTELAATVFDRLMEAGDGAPVAPAGFHALDSLRLEKGYRHWGHDMGPDETPFEAGLSFAVKLDKEVPFIGRDALLERREAGIGKRLAGFRLLDPGPLLYGHEPIYRNGDLVGDVTSAAYGHTLGAAVGLGYVNHPQAGDRDFILAGDYEIEVAGERVAAVASLRPFYDPGGERVRA